jgi:hypothetical protein
MTDPHVHITFWQWTHARHGKVMAAHMTADDYKVATESRHDDSESDKVRFMRTGTSTAVWTMVRADTTMINQHAAYLPFGHTSA